MKYRFAVSLMLMAVLLCGSVVLAQDKVAVITPASEAAEGLDLHAVGELFKAAESLEAFEKALNDSEIGVNNLDLDDNGEVDFIRVVEEVSGDTHVIILQVPLGKDEFQDVATIEVERVGDDKYNFQLHGNEVIYGADYYVVPSDVTIHRWPVIVSIYRPAYRPYRSAFHFGYYPRWWRPYRPVTVSVYRARTVRYTGRASFTVARTTGVRTTTRVNYSSRNSTLVRKKTTVNRSGRKTTVTKTTRTTRTRRRP